MQPIAAQILFEGLTQPEQYREDHYGGGDGQPCHL